MLIRRAFSTGYLRAAWGIGWAGGLGLRFQLLSFFQDRILSTAKTDQNQQHGPDPCG
jgi:hypothetical protein